MAIELKEQVVQAVGQDVLLVESAEDMLNDSASGNRHALFEILIRSRASTDNRASGPRELEVYRHEHIQGNFMRVGFGVP